MSPRSLTIMSGLLLAMARIGQGQQGPSRSLSPTLELPAPTGSFPVGRMAYHWVDSSRSDPFDSGGGGHREVMLYVWYPAVEQGGMATAAYFPDFALTEKAIGHKAMQAEFRDAYDAVAAGQVKSHAISGARVAGSGRRYPALVFSPGFGEASLTYSALLEDLASHGYIVIAIEHPHDGFSIRFPDGRIVPFAQAQWDSALARPHGAVQYQLAQIPIRAADIRFLLNQLAPAGNAPRPDRPLSHIDRARIGVFGHSLGGMAAAEACRDDPRVGACMNQDADYEGTPWLADSARPVMPQPFLFLASQHSLYASSHSVPPSDDALASEGLTRAQYDSIIHRHRSNQDSALASLPGGGYRVALETPDFSHRSFMDLPLLASGPDRVALAHHRRNMALVREFTLAFFAKYLEHRQHTFLDRSFADSTGVHVDHFVPRRTD